MSEPDDLDVCYCGHIRDEHDPDGCIVCPRDEYPCVMFDHDDPDAADELNA